MNKQEVEEMTLAYHQSGLCCTEAIIKSVTESFSDESSDAIPKIGSGFCAGIGKSKEDICGTVAGAIIALGFLFGRSTKDDDLMKTASLAADFRNRFIAKYSTTNCKELLEIFGEQDNMMKCKKMTAKASGMLAEMLSDTGGDINDKS